MFQIITEDSRILAINKPIGVSFHSENDSSESLIQKVRTAHNIKSDLFPVHRLDKVTSGIILFAKSKEFAAKLSTLFEEQAVIKIYIALSDKKPKKTQGKVVGDMSPSRRGTWKLERTLSSPAKTHFFCFGYKPNIRLFLLRPFSGKTHQLRVCLKSLGSPVLGDTKYSGKASDRVYLHSYYKEFLLDGHHYKIKALPTDGTFFNQQELMILIEEKMNSTNITSL